MVKPLFLIALLFSVPGQQTSTASESHQDFQTSVEKILLASGLSGSTTALIIKKQGASTDLFSYNPDLLLVPASTIKMFTTALALDVLGPDYRFKTELRGNRNNMSNQVQGDLCVKGNGDPWLIPERLWYLTQRLKATGVREITRNLTIDDSYFSGSPDAKGLTQDDSSSAYMAPAGAVSVGFNVIQIHIRPNPEPNKPAIIYTEPASDHLIVEGAINTTASQVSRYEAEVVAQQDKSVLKLSGNISINDKPRRVWRRITGPSQHAGSVFSKLLQETGINLSGKVNTGLCPDELPVIADSESPRLADIITKVNKYSNNFMAAQLARSIGAHVFGAPGTWDKGKQALSDFLTNKVGIAPGSFLIVNASGLHNVNKVSVRHVIQLLEYIYARPRLRIEFLNSLAVSGGTGTLEDRMQTPPSYGVVRGKTGTLSIASALSAYVINPDGEVILFSIITNNYQRGITSVLEVQDAIGNLLSTTQLVSTHPQKKTAIATKEAPGKSPKKN